MKSIIDRYIGVDLGGGKGKTTALAVIARHDGRAVVERLSPGASDAPLYDESLVATIRAIVIAAPRAVLAIDAPLALPACLRCKLPVCPGQTVCPDGAVIAMQRLVEGTPGSRQQRRGKPLVTPYTQRATEVYLNKRRGVLPRETLGQGMGPLTARAAHLKRALADLFHLNHNLIEVYPKATLKLLGFEQQLRRYKKHLRERETRAEILDVLSSDLVFAPGVWREECVKSDHVFDAVVCAYTAYLREREGWTLPAELADLAELLDDDGWIWVPPSAQERAEQEQAERHRQGAAVER